MTRKDYRLLAGVFNYQQTVYVKGSIPWLALQATAEAMARALKTDNPNFRHDTFMAACGLDSRSVVDA